MNRNQQLKYLPILIVIFFILLLTACGGEQNKTYTIGVINLSANMESAVEGFKEGMAELGYVEGENVTYIYEGGNRDG